MYNELLLEEHILMNWLVYFLTEQIDYSLPKPSKQEAAFHVMPMLGYNTLATINFLDAIGVREFTWFQEIDEELSNYPGPAQGYPHWVSMTMQCTVENCNRVLPSTRTMHCTYICICLM